VLPPADEDDAQEQTLRKALWQLGQSAFFHYPAQLVSGFAKVRNSPQLASDYGLWSGRTPTGEQQLGGLLEVSVADGSLALASTCSTCHAAQGDSGAVIPGAANSELDLGKLAVDSVGSVDGPPLHWGKGRLDTSPDGLDNPAAIPDLRVVSAQRYLHHDATLRNDLFALALRIETLLITTYQQGVRPPPEVALGLAVYLWDLAPPAAGEETTAGAQLFAGHCARCHLPPSYAGEPVPLGEIATQPQLGRSRERGTGSYRTPSLVGTKSRKQFFHDGTLSSVRAVLDPNRLLDSYAEGRHRAGPVPGHPFGLTLSASERADLTAFVESR
jgi:mono/diheme cytochrome c family protein